MKKFLRNILIYALLIAIVVVPINSVYLARRIEADTDKFKNVPNEIQFCNFGSSHGMHGFDYGDVKDSYVCFNFALASQSVSYDMRIMEYYYDRLAEGGTAFLVISYFSLFGEPEESNESFLSKNTRYYRFLPKELIKQYDAKTAFFEEKYPSLNTPLAKLLVALLSGQSRSEDDTVQSAYDIAVGENAAAAYKRHLENKFDEEGNLILNEEEIAAVYKMIELCKQKNVRPVLITTPYLGEYTDAIRENRPQFFDEFAGRIGEIQRNTGVEYYDYSTDERFLDDYSLFSDSDHLNSIGARKFTDIVLEETCGIMIGEDMAQ